MLNTNIEEYQDKITGLKDYRKKMDEFYKENVDYYTMYDFAIAMGKYQRYLIEKWTPKT